MNNSRKRPEIYRETITGRIESDLRHRARSTQVQFHPTEKTWQNFQQMFGQILWEKHGKTRLEIFMEKNK